MATLNETHDPGLRSWVAGANDGATDFPLQNLPFAVFRRRGSDEHWRGGVAIGDQVLDLAAVARLAPFTGAAAEALAAGAQGELNALMGLGLAAWSALRLALSRALREGAPQQESLQACLVPQSAVDYDVPAQVGDYTDFYTSIHHATNIGRLFRPDQPLMPNYKWVPIGYHGRSSSLGISGESVRRPTGQTMAPGATQPSVGPSRRLDIELELGVFIGPGNAKGQSIGIGQAEDHVFGICLLNDWSARDIQGWEYQPLGPFLSKNFATTLSPWVVTLEALAPFRTAWQRPADDPQPLPYLDSPQVRDEGAFDIRLAVELQTARMREAGRPGQVLCRTSYRHAYWTVSQMVAHHTVNGCNLRPGDLFGSGTLSGPAAGEAAALIEMTQGGMHPIAFADGETRTWLEDGDRVTLRGWCEKPDAIRIGFGTCVGTIAG